MKNNELVRTRQNEYARKHQIKNRVSADEIMRCYLDHPGTFYKEILPMEEIYTESHWRRNITTNSIKVTKK